MDVGIANGDQDYILHKGLVMIGCAGLALVLGDLQRTVLRTVRSGLWGESAGSRVPQAAELFLFQYRPFSGVITGNPPDQRCDGDPEFSFNGDPSAVPCTGHAVYGHRLGVCDQRASGTCFFGGAAGVRIFAV